MSLIMETYDSWKQCLSRNLGSQLTRPFVRERIATLSNKGQVETKKFTQAYGNERLEKVISWFKQLEQEL